MKNGDSMTCEVKGLDAGVLYTSFDYIDGTTSVDWMKVARLKSTQLLGGIAWTPHMNAPSYPSVSRTLQQR